MNTPDISSNDNLRRTLSSQETSKAISLARIILIVGLVFLHYDAFPNSNASPFDGLDTASHSFATWVNSATLFFFFSTVPLLSMISGWLFFSFKGNPWKAISERIRRRFTSLYLPLVAWNAAILAGTYALFAFHSNFPLLDKLNIDFQSAKIIDYVNAVFALTQHPIAFQFWFVRDLFVTALISPIFWLLIRYAPWIGALVLGIAWLSKSHLGIFFRLDVPFFFYLGALIQLKHLPTRVPLKLATTFLVLYVVLAGTRALAPEIIDLSSGKPSWLYVLTCLMRLIGVVGCWGMLHRAAQTDWGVRMGNYGGLAFFLHSAHWPLLVILKIWLWPLMPAQNDFWMLVHYALSVTLTVTIGLGLGLLLSQRAPKFFALMNGGRLLKPPTNRMPQTTSD